jgi:DNA-binding MarR family transcriptional regulator
VPAHDCCDRGEVGRAAGRGVEDGGEFAEVVWAENAGRDDRESLGVDHAAAHLNVFQYPGPEGARPSELAARLRISKQALNYLLGELERLGYLERRADPDDLRSKRVALTPRRSSAIGAIREAVVDLESTWAQQLGAKRFAQLRGLLLELNRLT